MTICSHMICPFCSSKTKIYNSRSTQSQTQTWRRHQCTACKRSFTTKERIDWTGRIKIKSSDETALYSRERLMLSLVRASNNLTLPTGALTDLTDTIELELQNGEFFTGDFQEAELITHVATTVLHRYDPNVALQYINMVYRNKPPLELIKRLLTP